MSGVPLNPQSIIPIDTNISTLSYLTSITPPYQNVSSGSYNIFIHSQSDLNLLSYDRGTFSNIGYYNYSTVAETLIGSSNGQFMFQNKSDYTYFPLATRISPFNTVGCTIAYNGSIYVAVGSGINAIATSVDGIAWVPRGQSIMLTIYTVTWNGSLWLVGGAVSGSYALATSPDGITWTALQIYPASISPSRGAWSSTLGLALFGQVSGDTIYSTSPNGTIWTRRGSPISYFGTIVWNGYYFLGIAGQTLFFDAYAYYSYDGINWATSGTFTNGYGVTGLYAQSIAWSSTLGIWVCAHYNNYSSTYQLLSYSYDGKTWNTAFSSLGSALGSAFYDVVWNGTYFLAAGNVPCYYSSDGINWISTGFKPTPVIYALSWNGTYWIAGGNVSTTSMYYNTSATASLAWTNSTNIFTTQCYDIKYNGSILVAVGSGTNSIAYSTNGTSWTGIPSSTTNFSTSGRGVLWSAELGLWMVSGTGSHAILTSPDGINWTPRYSNTMTNVVQGSAWSPLLNQWATVGSGTYVVGTTNNFTLWNTNNSIFTTQGWAVIWSAVHNLWIAGGQGTNTLATSTDGISWTARTSPITTAVYGLGFNGSIYVAVGTGTNVFASSTDGVVWTARGSSGITTSGRAVAWAPSLSLWVAVGSGTNSIATSPDGTTWSGITTTTVFSTTGYGVNWSTALAQFIAAGQGTNTLATSKDGVNWLGTTTINAVLTNVYCIVWNGTLWVAGGSAGSSGSYTIASSTDGINWTGRSTGVIGNVYGVAWSGALWVAVGTGTNVFASSTDGQTWTARGSAGITTAGRGVIWYGYNSIWVAVGSGTNSIATSPDGFTWTGRTTTTIFSTSGYCIASLRNLLVAGGVGTNCIATSADGFSWTGRNTTGVTVFSLAYSPILSRWLAGADQSYIGYSDNNAVTWNFYQNVSSLPYSNYGLIWNGTYFVSVGGVAGPQIAAISADGITWKRSIPTNNDTTFLSCIAARPPIMVAAGSGTNTICLSRDNGITWTQSTTGISVMTTVANAVAWNGNIWVAVGQGTNSIATSPDGVTWTGRTTTAIFSTAGFDILWIDKLKLWIAVGTGTNAIATSPDGVNWTSRVLVATGSFSTGAYRIGWNGNQILVLGNGTNNSLALSTNGTSWILLGLPITASASGYGGIAWSGQLWAAVSDAATNIWTSPDGITWTSRATLTSGNCRSIAWNGSIFFVLGSSTYCATSPNGITWTMLNTQPQTTFVRATWNNSSTQWVVCGTTATASIYTTPNGQTWTLRQNAMITNATTQSFAWAPSIGTWALVGGTTNNIATATDAAGAWVSRVTTGMGTAYCVAWNGSIFVAGGGTTVQIYTSTDGVTWTSQTNGGVAWTVVYGLAWSSSLSIWVGVGANGATSGVLASSTNGTAWTSRSTSIFGAGGAGYCVAVNTAGNLFVAGGTVTTTFAYSSNGTTWNAATGIGTSITVAVRGVIWSSTLSLWVAVGNGTNCIATSPDGNTWSGRTGTVIFATQGSQIATNSNIIIATGTGTNQYAYSYDAINWFNGTAPFASTALGIAWNSTTGEWLMGSSTAAFPYYVSSPDGLTWTPRQTFTTSVRGIGYPLQREKTYTITNTNWTGRTTQQNFRIVSV